MAEHVAAARVITDGGEQRRRRAGSSRRACEVARTPAERVDAAIDEAIEADLAYGRDAQARHQASTTAVAFAREIRAPSLRLVPTTAPSTCGASAAAFPASSPLPM
jgi:hypothetical protein